MERQSFLKRLLLEAISAPAVLSACNSDEAMVTPTDTSGSVTTPGTASGNCTVAPSETQGSLSHQKSGYLRKKRLPDIENQLAQLVTGGSSAETGPVLPSRVSLGRFNGRQEAVYRQ
jgi:hypothetical protein